MNRRVDAPGLDARASAALDTRAPDKASLSSVSRRSLSKIGKANSRAAEASDTQQKDLGELDFAADTQSARSLDAILADFVMPSLADPAILKRSNAILQAFVDDIVPGLEGGEQLRELARSLMADEIVRRRELMARMQEDAS